MEFCRNALQRDLASDVVSRLDSPIRPTKLILCASGRDIAPSGTSLDVVISAPYFVLGPHKLHPLRTLSGI
jgi:hypothetical protein